MPNLDAPRFDMVGRHEPQSNQSEGEHLQHTVSALDKMAEIRVTIDDIEPSIDEGPIRFCMQDVPNAKTLVEILSQGCGPGSLWDSDMVYVSPSSARQLVPGDYTFRVGPVPEGPSTASTLATGLLSALEEFATTIEEICQDDDSLPGRRAFFGTPPYEVCSAADEHGFTVLYGPDIADLPKPKTSTAKCDNFPLRRVPDTDSASRSLAAYHTDMLEKMGLVMGPDGLKVLDLHDKKDLLSIHAGDYLYSGGIHYAVVPHGVPEAEAAKSIRVGFLHVQTKVDEGGSGMTSLTRHYPGLIMTMLAAVDINKDPLDLVITDGTAFTLCRFQEDDLLLYRDLPAQQAYYAVAQPLLLQQLQAEKLPRPTEPSAETAADCTLKRKLEDCSVDLGALQDHTHSMTSSSGPVAKRVACASDGAPQKAP